MAFDARFPAVEDGAKPQVPLERSEGLLDFAQPQIELPEFAGIVSREVRAKQVASLAAVGLPQLRAIETIGEGDGGVFVLRRSRQVDLDVPLVPACLVSGGADLLEQRRIPERLPGDRGRALEQLANPAQPHGALLHDAVGAFHVDDHLPVLLEQLHLHLVANRVPGLLRQRALQLGEAPLGRADHVLAAAGGQLLERFLGGDAPIHQPDPAGAAVEPLDLVEKGPQRGVVGRVALHDLVGHGEPLGRDHQRDDDLHAVAAMVPTVAVCALVPRRKGRFALEVRARQIVEKHVAGGVEHVHPAPAQMLEERVLVFEQPVQAAIERVLGRQFLPASEQIAHGRALEPLPVDAPFVRWVEESIGAEDLEHVKPGGTLARRGQKRSPECVEAELLPERAEHPAPAVLARILQRELRNADRDGIGLAQCAVLGKTFVGQLEEQLLGSAPGA